MDHVKAKCCRIRSSKHWNRELPVLFTVTNFEFANANHMTLLASMYLFFFFSKSTTYSVGSCTFMSQCASVNQCRHGLWVLEFGNVVSKVVGGFGRGAILGRTGCHQHADPFCSQSSRPSPILYNPWSTILSEAIVNANAFVLSPSNTLFSLESESPRMHPSIQSAGSLIVSAAAQLMMHDVCEAHTIGATRLCSTSRATTSSTSTASLTTRRSSRAYAPQSGSCSTPVSYSPTRKRRLLVASAPMALGKVKSSVQNHTWSFAYPASPLHKENLWHKSDSSAHLPTFAYDILNTDTTRTNSR
ncbi:hypothetical protein EDB84DRAFT_1121635 [Lactarius hengduanensis]|nr:hypothetical protein EDB84DRAFT_1121635 [Lactarius hengduanensis]